MEGVCFEKLLLSVFIASGSKGKKFPLSKNVLRYRCGTHRVLRYRGGTFKGVSKKGRRVASIYAYSPLRTAEICCIFFYCLAVLIIKTGWLINFRIILLSLC